MYHDDEIFDILLSKDSKTKNLCLAAYYKFTDEQKASQLLKDLFADEQIHALIVKNKNEMLKPILRLLK